MNINELPYHQSPEMHFRRLVTTLKYRLQGGSNLFALGPRINRPRILFCAQNFHHPAFQAGHPAFPAMLKGGFVVGALETLS